MSIGHPALCRGGCVIDWPKTRGDRGPAALIATRAAIIGLAGGWLGCRGPGASPRDTWLRGQPGGAVPGGDPCIVERWHAVDSPWRTRRKYPHRFSTGRSGQLARVEVTVVVAIEAAKLSAQVVLEFPEGNGAAPTAGQFCRFQRAIAIVIHSAETRTHVVHVLGAADMAVTIGVEHAQIFGTRVRDALPRARQHARQQCTGNHRQPGAPQAAAAVWVASHVSAAGDQYR